MGTKQRIFVDEEKTVHAGIHCVEDDGDIEICFDEGCQDIRNFQGFEINPLSL